MSLKISKFYTTWAPDLISTALWLDASDSSTIIQSGGSVIQWNDKSGNNRHVSQAVSANQPLYQANTVNNNTMPSLLFDGSNDVLSTTLSTGLSGSFAFIAVASFVTINQFGALVVSEVASYSNYWATLSLGTGAGSRMVSNLFDGTNNPGAGNTIPTTNTLNLFMGVRDTQASPKQVALYTNGSLTQSVTDTTTSVPVYSALRVGGQVSQSNRYANARICEVLVVPSLITTIQRQKLEGYLSWKWGTTSNLPSDHPFRWKKPEVND